MTIQRADLVLVNRGFFPTRAKAQEAIALGLVRVAGKALTKASAMIDDAIAIEAEKPYPWVSRGGVKLAAALDAFGFDPKDRICLDVGASTGGFTDVLLARGAAQVYAVDVGRGQLDAKLRDDRRVVSMEATDARNLTPAIFAAPPAFITFDVSFISLRLVLPAVLPLTAEGAKLVALIKPQFEVGPAFVTKGIVKDDAKRQEACAAIDALIGASGWTIDGLIPSPIEGTDGNREFLIGATKTNAEAPQ
ncbi:MAG TPA: TlyA family RNA methyltransferase [Methylovirgula sp.]|jgi:23S rRNA (cytidine1920-2'-O)/16S rRNA (cytidine1409-2'-O)-methyltransferase|nr:TlyA family RNA methyltransferase [Methylovirgula sp.]